jgi:hypothetical protein
MPNTDQKKAEYLDVSENIRHWQNLRFAQLTVFIIVTGAVTGAIFQGQTPPPAPIQLMLQFAGLIIVVIFWLFDERNVKYWLNFVRRAERLEKELGFEQYSPPHESGLFAASVEPHAVLTVRNAIRLLFLVFFLFWSYLFIVTLVEII